MFEVKDICKEFGEGDTLVKAVSHANLKISNGEIVFIMGPSGSGKTTLLSMMGLLLTPTRGEIYLDGEKVSSLPQKTMAKVRLNKIGFVFQNFQLISSLTVLENVQLVLTLAGKKGPSARKKSIEILTHLGLERRLNHFPHKLSGGEKQRVAIARALVNDPSIILADEPTANLDSHNGHLVAELLQNIVKETQKCLLVVTHDPRITWIAERTYIMEDGILRENIN